MQEERTTQCHCECLVCERKHKYCIHRQEALCQIHANTPMDINALIAKCSNTLSDVSESEASIKPIERTPALLQYSALRTFALACQVFNGDFSEKTLAVKASPVLCQSLCSPSSSVSSSPQLDSPEVETIMKSSTLKRISLRGFGFILYAFHVLCQMKLDLPAATAMLCQSWATTPVSVYLCQGRADWHGNRCVFTSLAFRRQGLFKGVKASLTSAAAVSRATLMICGRSLGWQ